MPGLVPESEAVEDVSTVGGDHAFSTTSDDGTTGMQGQTGSHLDSLFQGSGWTREDVMLLLMVLQASLLLLWYVGVSDA